MLKGTQLLTWLSRLGLGRFRRGGRENKDRMRQEPVFWIAFFPRSKSWTCRYFFGLEENYHLSHVVV